MFKHPALARTFAALGGTIIAPAMHAQGQEPAEHEDDKEGLKEGADAEMHVSSLGNR
ncbi:exported hypothetical protein [Verrucomicrobia bacterium]|nr:exported hypothetical protein [Verrucomicrobiota bacterium]